MKANAQNLMKPMTDELRRKLLGYLDTFLSDKEEIGFKICLDYALEKYETDGQNVNLYRYGNVDKFTIEIIGKTKTK